MKFFLKKQFYEDKLTYKKQLLMNILVEGSHWLCFYYVIIYLRELILPGHITAFLPCHWEHAGRVE